MKIKNLSFYFFLLFSTVVNAQFSTENIVSSTINPIDIHLADLDNDGDMDIISINLEIISSTSAISDLVWFENTGGGTFSTEKPIATHNGSLDDIYAADLDADEDIDIIVSMSCSSPIDFCDEIVWFENTGIGSGIFSTPIVIYDKADAPRDIYVTDIIKDNRNDVLFIEEQRGRIGLCLNNGNGASFTTDFVYETDAIDNFNGLALEVADLDGDGEKDIISASYGDDRILWFRNLGGGDFSTLNIIQDQSEITSEIHIADLDGNGKVDDILFSSFLRNSIDGKLGWYKNDGSGVFQKTFCQPKML